MATLATLTEKKRKHKNITAQLREKLLAWVARAVSVFEGDQLDHVRLSPLLRCPRVDLVAVLVLESRVPVHTCECMAMITSDG